MKTKKLFILAALVLISLNSLAQTRYQITKSNVSFFSAASLENIEANNSDTKGIIDADAKTFLFKIPVKSFKFKSELMQDHFNENYMESEKYPDASFKGKIEGNYDMKKDGNYPVNAVGDLTIHGVTQKRIIPCTLSVKNGIPSIDGKFNVKLADHNIEIPTIVFNKIAEVVEVKVAAVLARM